MYHNTTKRYLRLLLIMLVLAPAVHIYGEGSKDLYPEGARGNRAFLISMTGQYAFNPFTTLGRMMVYAKAGETIYVGSSSQGIGNGTIRLYTPNGTLYTSGNSTTLGRIANRTQELAGPKPFNANGYEPFTRVVGSGEEGIWVIEFYAQGTNQSGNQSGGQNTASILWGADQDWSVTVNNPINNVNSAFITAWDVTVGNGSTVIPGRVYTTVFNMGMNKGLSPGQNHDGFFGKFYALTRDGYSYLIDNNGQNGLSFNTFVNNKGTLNPDGTPSYKSFGYSNVAELIPRFHDPRSMDNELHVTHKMFYNKPASDMPATADMWQPTSGLNWPTVWNNTTGATTQVWLRTPRGSMNIGDLRLEGEEGTDGFYTSKGAYFIFNSEVEGRYRITIPASVNSGSADRVLEGDLVLGQNRVYWDGLDGNGQEFGHGDNLSDVNIQVFAAEVHFPFIDVENNVDGITIQALDENHNTYSPVGDKDVVWWDVSDLSNGQTVNPPANKNTTTTGHHSMDTGPNQLKWGVIDGGNNFGDNRAIVEWIRQTQYTEKEELSVSKLVTDLEVVSVTKNANNFIVPVKNHGGSVANGKAAATFMFYVPAGVAIDPAAVTFQTTEGITYSGTMVFVPVDSITDPARAVSCLTVKLNMPAGATGTFTIPFTVTGTFSTDWINVWGTIMRANDVYDPNAFNRILGINPTDPFKQANGIQKSLPDLNLNAEVVTNPDFANLTITNPSNSNYTNNIKYLRTVLNNYWYGGVPDKENEWREPGNWTANMVPLVGESIEFATDANNGSSGNGNGLGAAVSDLYLDDVDQNESGGRIIGDLINDSDQNLVITAGNQLRINGTVKENNGEGTIIVKADPADLEPSGTLIFAQPANNQNVEATVEFYNQAYDCETCGFYRRSWQYFGIPVNSANFPHGQVEGEATVNRWTEPYNGDKWRPVELGSVLEAFDGYQVTNSSKTKPVGVYDFRGTLNAGNAKVELTKTGGVNYPGANLVGNSYTAAIPISGEALGFPDGFDQTVYLFNTGTRDQWRKLNGTIHNEDGYQSGQYLAVPVNIAGTNPNLPDRIPSMHAFMVLFPDAHAPTTPGNFPELGINYNQLLKNTLVDRGDGTPIVTRSGNTGGGQGTTTAPSSGQQLPALVMDVIGEQSADRVWIFGKEGTTHGFDNGWDGRKMPESGIAQLYVVGSDESRLQVATVPTMDDVVLGFDAEADGKYTLEFSLSVHLKSAEVYLHDLVTGAKERVSDGGSYTFEAKKGASTGRFRLTYAGNDSHLSDDEALIDVTATTDGKIMIRNNSSKPCTVFISNTGGKLLQRLEVQGGSEEIAENITVGTYIVRLQNDEVSDVRKVTVK